MRGLLSTSWILGTVCHLSKLSSNYADVPLATWTEHHFMDNIQMQWYCSLEAVLGVKWGMSADIWGVACIVSLVPTSLCFMECCSVEVTGCRLSMLSISSSSTMQSGAHLSFSECHVMMEMRMTRLQEGSLSNSSQVQRFCQRVMQPGCVNAFQKCT